MIFCLASYVDLLKESLAEDISDENLLNMLVEKIVKENKIQDKNGMYFYFDKIYTSKVMNNKRTVPRKLKAALSTEATKINNIVAYFEQELLPKLIVEKIPQLCEDICMSINDCSEISGTIKREVGDCLEGKKYTELLALAFRCSLMVNNHFEQNVIEIETEPRCESNTSIKNINLLENIKLINGELYSALGAASILMTWEEDNNLDKKIIEKLTGLNYVDYIEELNQAGIDINVSGRIASIGKALLAARKELIERIHKAHLDLLFDSLFEVIAESTLYFNLSSRMAEAVFDFIAFAGSNISINKRISENDWVNYLCVFGRRIFGGKSEYPIGMFVSKYELFVEGSVKVALHLVREQIDDNGLLIGMLKDSHNKSITYYLSNAIRKAAAKRETFSESMLVLLDLSKYDNIFFDNMIYVMNPAYIQTEADFIKRNGIIKNLFRKNSNQAWKLVLELAKNGNNQSSLRRKFSYVNVNIVDLDANQYKEEIRYYINFLCENLRDEATQIIDMVNLIPYVQGEYIDPIINTIIDKANNCVDDEEICKSINHYLEYPPESIGQKHELMEQLSNHFVPARMRFEKKKLFSYEHYLSNDEAILHEQEEFIQTLFERGGINQLYELIHSVRSKEVFAQTVYRVLPIDSYYGLIDTVKLKDERYVSQLLVAEMSADEIINYCSRGTLKNFDFESLAMHPVNDQLVDFAIQNNDKNVSDYWKNVWVTDVRMLSKNSADCFFERTLGAGNISAALMFLIVTKDYGDAYGRIFRVLEKYTIPAENITKDNNKFQIQELIHILQVNASNQADRIVGVEEKFLAYLLPYEHVSPKYIYYKMANEPKYVHNILKRDKGRTENGIFDTNFYNLIYHFRLIVGSKDDGTFEYKSLEEWFDYANEVEDAGIRDEMMRILGRSLYHVEPDEDGFIVNRKVAEFIEDYADENMMREFHVEAINSHGPVNIGPDSHEEENLINAFLYKADECDKEGYIRLASEYRSIADSWSR